ncbi:MAG: SCP2 sterol-binding domain-containing protein [Bacteroidia bacterium]|nr:SCP2 sterol-binding domain-containing protein [Bacteroidia bacterium]
MLLDLSAKKLILEGHEVREVEDGAQAACTIAVQPADLLALLKGELSPMQAFMGGRIKVMGDSSVAMQLVSLFR